MLASLKERSTCGILDYFLGVGDEGDLEEEFLADDVIERKCRQTWTKVRVRTLGNY